MDTGKLLTIYIVDDNEIDVFISRKMLEKHLPDAQVSVFENGQEAYEALIKKDVSELPDLIMLDIKMPMMDGFSFLEECAASPNPLIKDLNVIMLSSSIDPIDIKRSLSFDNVKKFANKPLLWDCISTTISQIMEDKKLNMAI